MGHINKLLPRRLGSGAVALGAALGLVLLAPAGSASAYTTVDYTEVALTQQELDDNWITDRAAPSGGHESVSFDDRSDVLEVRIDKDARSSDSSFYYTEGLKRDVGAVDAARIDLYLDGDWSEKDVRAGFWGVGEDDAAAVTAYPIVEFTTTGEDGFTGWRVYDSDTGVWENLAEGFDYDEWVTLELVLDAANDEFDVLIDGEEVATSPALGSTSLGDVIVNQYNFGPEAQSYDVHWSNFATGTLASITADECKNGGWQDFATEYKNQGQCVADAQRNEHSKHHRG